MILIESTMEKIARIYSKNTGVNILMGDCFKSDSRNKIIIPPISDRGDPWIKFMTEVGVYHELGHVLYTDPDNHTNDKHKFPIFNTLEDTRIEKLVTRKWKGITRKQIKFIRGFIDREINNRWSNPTIPLIKKILDLTYLRVTEKRTGEGLGFKGIPAEVEQLWQEKISSFVDRIIAAETQDEINILTNEIYERLKQSSNSESQDQSEQRSKNQSNKQGSEKSDSEARDNEENNEENQSTSSEPNEQNDENRSDGKDDTGDTPASEDEDEEDAISRSDNEESNESTGKSNSTSGKTQGSEIDQQQEQLTKELEKDLKISDIGQEMADKVNAYANGVKLYREKPGLKDNITKLDQPQAGWNTEVENYEKAGREMTGYCGAKLRTLFISERSPRWTRNHKSGKLDLHKLWADHTNDVFRRRTDYVKEDSAVSLIIDNSASMTDEEKSHIASSLLTILATELDRLRIPFEVTAFTGKSLNGIDADEGIRSKPTDIRIIKEFDEPYRKIRFRFQWKSGIYTPPFPCLKYAASRLSFRTETKKVLFILSDGITEFNNDVLEASMVQAQKEYVLKLKKAGFKIVGFGIKDDSILRWIPKSDCIIIQDLQKFANEFYNKLTDILLKRR